MKRGILPHLLDGLSTVATAVLVLLQFLYHSLIEWLFGDVK